MRANIGRFSSVLYPFFCLDNGRGGKLAAGCRDGGDGRDADGLVGFPDAAPEIPYVVLGIRGADGDHLGGIYDAAASEAQDQVGTELSCDLKSFSGLGEQGIGLDPGEFGVFYAVCVQNGAYSVERSGLFNAGSSGDD